MANTFETEGKKENFQKIFIYLFILNNNIWFVIPVYTDSCSVIYLSWLRWIRRLSSEHWCMRWEYTLNLGWNLGENWVAFALAINS